MARVLMGEAETLSPVLSPEAEAKTREVLAAVQRLGLVLATAESCIGGMIASLLTDVQGMSHVFDRGFVTYSEAAKCDLLGVPEKLLAAHGAVSREVAIAMAEGALTRSRADIAVAVTGFADAGDEPGLVHFACAGVGQATVHREEHFGPVGRGAVRLAALDVAVALIEQMLPGFD
jgi:nicotinamide-nucleotide amidase